MPSVRVSNDTLDKLRRLRDELGVDSLDAVISRLVDMYTNHSPNMHTYDRSSSFQFDCRAVKVNDDILVVDCGGGKIGFIPRESAEDFTKRFRLSVLMEG